MYFCMQKTKHEYDKYALGLIYFDTDLYSSRTTLSIHAFIFAFAPATVFCFSFQLKKTVEQCSIYI